MPTLTLCLHDLDALRPKVRKNVELILELSELRWRYLHEAHGTFEGLDGSRSLAYWEAYFEVNPRKLTPKREVRLSYLKGTLGTYEISQELEDVRRASVSRRERKHQ